MIRDRNNRLLPANDRHENVYSLTKGVKLTQHIPGLPREEHAQQMLERIRREFHPLAQARGYTIPTLTEMCCCSDGIHHIMTSTTSITSSGRTLTRKRKKYGRRRFRRMSNNVQGYNYGFRGNSHEIHLRLRRPQSHSFYSYEQVVDVMIHELTHCEIGAHSAEFYYLMEEIAQQFNTYLERGLVVDKQGFPLLQDKAYRLGGANPARTHSSETTNAASGTHGASKIISGKAHVNPALPLNNEKLGEIVHQRKRSKKAVELKAKRGYKLGSSTADNSLTLLPNGTLGKGSWKKLTPKEAAREAAERRQRDSLWCLPCNELVEILDLTSDHSSDEESDDEILEIFKAPTNGDNNQQDSDIRAASKLDYEKDSKDQDSLTTNTDTKTLHISSLSHQSDFYSSTNTTASQDTTELPIHSPVVTDKISSANQVETIPLTVQSGVSDKKLFTNNTVDLTLEDDILLENGDSPKTTLKAPPSASHSNSWPCSTCTFINTSLLLLACEICNTPRVVNEEKHSKVLQSQWAVGESCRKSNLSENMANNLTREELIQLQKEREHKISIQAFGGFNIYGTKKKNTRTMGHLT